MDGTISLDAIAVFVQVAETASFRRAGEALGLPRSTVSRKVADLEARLGARLLRRTTRRVSLTDAGAAYLRACQPALGALGEAARTLRASAVEARGRLRITASIAFGERYLGPLVDAYLRAHPHVEVEVVLTDRHVDVIQEGFDLAFRAGDVGDESLVARELSRGTVRCVASPSYLEGKRKVRRPADLAGHEHIVYPPLAPGGRWSFRVQGRTVHVPARGRLVVSSLPLALDAAERGLGIACVPGPLAADALGSGALVELLAAFRQPLTTFYLVHPSGAQATPRLRAFLDVTARLLELPRG